jgi:hypothetical protein
MAVNCELSQDVARSTLTFRMATTSASVLLDGVGTGDGGTVGLEPWSREEGHYGWRGVCAAGK